MEDYYELFNAHVKKLKKTGEGQYVGLCPFHDDTNPSFSVKITDGLYNCFSCGEKGNHITFRKKLGLPLPERGTRDPHRSSIPEDVIALLKEKYGKALSPRVINHFRIQHSFATSPTTGERTNRLILPTNDEWYERLDYEKPDEKGKIRWKLPSRAQVPNSAGGSYIGKFKAAGENPVFIMEGEWDCFTAYDRGIEYAISFTNGAKHVPAHHIKDFTGKNIVICYDYDDAGLAGAQVVADALFGLANSIKITDWTNSGLKKNSGDLKDFTDYIKTLGKSADDFQKLVEEAPAFTRKLDPGTLTETLASFDEIAEKSEYVLRVLKDFGYFVKAEGLKFRYWFNKSDRRLYLLDKKDTNTGYFLNHYFGLNAEKNDFKEIVFNLATYCNYNGKTSRIYNFSHYDETANALYIYNNDRSVYRITEDSVTETANGENEVLFLENESLEPFKYRPSTVNGESLLEEFLFGQINFGLDTKTHPLNPEEQRMVFRYYFYSLFFCSLLPSKPLLLLKGDAGSGKSMIMKMLILLFLGKKRSVKTLPKDEKDFIAALYNNYFVFYDNVDERIDTSILDKVAAVSTKMEVSAKLLYTNFVETSFIPDCFLGFSSRTNVLNRADIADRTLIFTMKRFEESERDTDKKLMDSIENNKDAMWTEILNTLREIVKRMKNFQKSSVKGSKLRVADFCNLAEQMAPETDRPFLLKAFEKMAVSQSMFTLTNDVLYNVIEHLATMSDGQVALSMDRKEFYELFKETADSLGYETEQRRSKGGGFPTEMGVTQYIKKKAALYEKAFHVFKVTSDRTPRIIIYHTTGRDKDQGVADFMSVHAEKVSWNSTIAGMPKGATQATRAESAKIDAIAAEGQKTSEAVTTIAHSESVMKELFDEEPETLEPAYSDDDPFSNKEE